MSVNTFVIAPEEFRDSGLANCIRYFTEAGGSLLGEPKWLKGDELTAHRLTTLNQGRPVSGNGWAMVFKAERLLAGYETRPHMFVAPSKAVSASCIGQYFTDEELAEKPEPDASSQVPSAAS